MTVYRNPFDADHDRADIWEMLVARDTRAFVSGDWEQIADDFLPDAFLAVDGRMRANPDSWRLGLGTLNEYRLSWLEQSAAMRDLVANLETGLYEAVTLRDIEIEGDRALAHKKFDGQIRRYDGGAVQLHWQTLYMCRRVDGRWRIAGFIGYLPNPMGGAPSLTADGEAGRPAKELPEKASQPRTAGPYSPVLEVRADRLVVLSGQAAVAPDGSLIGETVEEQTRATLDACAARLAAAGCTFADVFKVNAFLADIGMWDAFNSVYRQVMPAPLPVRTTVGTQLLGGFLVELEMWAVKP